MSGHTPGPWTTRQALHKVDGAYDFAIAAEHNDRRFVIAEAYGRADEDLFLPAKANAEFIVRACNSHDDMRHTLTVIAERAEELTADVARDGFDANELLDAMIATGEKARAALKKGEPE